MPTKTRPKKSFKDKARSAKPATRHVSVCLHGDLYSEIQRLDAELVAILNADTDGDDRLVGNPAARDLADRIEALRVEMAEDTEDFTIAALPHGRFSKIQADCPPRLDDPKDMAAGYNRDQFMAVLLRTCVVSPQLDDDDWDLILGRDPNPDDPDDKGIDPVINTRQYDELTAAAWIVNTGDVSVPFSPAASKVLKSGSESKRPNA